MIVYFAVLNVMTGVFCQNAIETAEKDQDLLMHSLSSERQEITRKLKAVFKDTLDERQEGFLTLETFESHMQSDALKTWFASIDIDIVDGWTLFKLLDTERTGVIEIDDFVDG